MYGEQNRIPETICGVILLRYGQTSAILFLSLFTLFGVLIMSESRTYDEVVKVYQGELDDDFDIGCELFYEVFADIDWKEEIINNA
tara:strand:+ start:331 stop:588 length:258 start_codon:yes stop_codon:yes gene_type:complete